MLNVTYLEDNYCFQSLLVPNSIGILVCVDFYSYSFDSRAKHCTLATEYASLLEYQTLWPLQYWINNKDVQLFGYCYLLICRNIHLQVLPKHFYQAQGISAGEESTCCLVWQNVDRLSATVSEVSLVDAPGFKKAPSS